MEDLLSKLAAQWDVIRSAPMPFFLTAVALGTVIWIFISWSYATILVSKDSQIALWKDRAEASEKAATPEVQRLLARRWSPLTDEEMEALRRALRDTQKPTGIFVRCGDSDCLELADTFISVFKSLTWEPSFEGEPTSGFVQSGILIMQGDGKNRTLADAISTATKGRLTASVQPTSLNSVRLIIGRKP